MKNVEKSTLQGWTERIGQGLAKKLGVVALGAAFVMSPMASSTAIAAGSGTVTHLECIQWIVQMVGDQLPASATSSDYVQWAQAKGMSPNGGWQPGAKLTKQAFAQILVQLYNLKENKYGGDYVRILAREGIYLPDEEEISRAGLVSVADDAVVQRHTTGPGGPKGDNPHKPSSDFRPSPGPADRSAGKVTLCHKGRNTITVSQNALKAHLDHGDTIGPCSITQTQNP